MRFRLTINQQRFALTINYRLVDNHFFDIFHGRQIVHGIEQCGFYDGTQATGTGFTRHRFLSDSIQRLVTEFQIHAFQINSA